MNLLATLYEESSYKLGSTSQYKAFERTFKCNDDFEDALIDTVNDESYEAFKVGFRTAIQLLTGGNDND